MDRKSVCLVILFFISWFYFRCLYYQMLLLCPLFKTLLTCACRSSWLFLNTTKLMRMARSPVLEENAQTRPAVLEYSWQIISIDSIVESAIWHMPLVSLDKASRNLNQPKDKIKTWLIGCSFFTHLLCWYHGWLFRALSKTMNTILGVILTLQDGAAADLNPNTVVSIF